MKIIYRTLNTFINIEFSSLQISIANLLVKIYS